ncbi:MAG TPA: 50S ribosomal protein L10 [Pyrinomonadaceae bacterium]|nr:50S ribosomal protein L10 [Pyrinomonadaceae bacterium]
MREEKKFIGNEYVTRLNASPFFIVVDYRGVTVKHFNELRKRLRGAGAEAHVVKNSIFRIAAKEAKVADLASGTLAGQIAVVTGQKDVSAAAKILKNFQAEFEKPKLQFGYLNNSRLEAKDLQALADLPSLDVLRGKLLGTLLAPATTLVRLLNTPASQLARVLQARADKEGGEAKAA